MTDWDTSVPRESAERLLGVKPGALSLDELARRVSVCENFTSDPVSVRDPSVRPILHSGVYLRGEATSATPYFVHVGLGKKG